jgi:hypothetical protein
VAVLFISTGYIAVMLVLIRSTLTAEKNKNFAANQKTIMFEHSYMFYGFAKLITIANSL